MRKCKCQITKEIGTTDIFYKVNENGKNKYYKNKKIYDKYMKQKNDRDILLKYIALEILDYQEKQIVPTILLKKIKELNEFYEYEVIYEAFKEKKDTLKYWINLDGKFNSEYQKVSYMMAIINNSINDIYERWKIKQQRLQKENSINVDMNVLNDSEAVVVPKSEAIDISQFLDGEDD